MSTEAPKIENLYIFKGTADLMYDHLDVIASIYQEDGIQFDPQFSFPLWLDPQSRLEIFLQQARSFPQIRREVAEIVFGAYDITLPEEILARNSAVDFPHTTQNSDLKNDGCIIGTNPVSLNQTPYQKILPGFALCVDVNRPYGLAQNFRLSPKPNMNPHDIPQYAQYQKIKTALFAAPALFVLVEDDYIAAIRERMDPVAEKRKDVDRCS